MNRSTGFATLIVLALLSPIAHAAFVAPYSDDFEAYAPGDVPAGWKSGVSTYCPSLAPLVSFPALTYETTVFSVSGGKGAAGTTQSLHIQQSDSCLLYADVDARYVVSNASAAVSNVSLYLAMAGAERASVALVDNRSHEIAHLLIEDVSDYYNSVDYRYTTNRTSDTTDPKVLSGTFVKVSFSNFNFGNNSLTVSLNDGPTKTIRMTSSLVNGFSAIHVEADDSAHVWIDEIVVS